MPRIPDREFFLNKLKKLSGKNGDFVSNEKLRRELKWKKEKYKAIHRSLKQQGLVIVRRGYGGSVAPGDNKKSGKLRIFISYSHSDHKLKEQLVNHLRPLERENLIEVWEDQQIPPGDDWDKTIAKRLDQADIILPLVSIDFINSKYCYDVEMGRALIRQEAGKAKVVPVILRSCLWQKSPLGQLKALPTDGKAVTTWPDVDAALTVVADGIRDAAIDLDETR